MKICFFLSVLMLWAGSIFAASSNFHDCLSALNSKTVQFKGKIKSISDDGSIFAVNDFLGNGATVVYTPTGAFSISSKSKPQCQARGNVSDTASGIMELLVLSTAMGNDPKNSEKNKKALLEICRARPPVS